MVDTNASITIDWNPLVGAITTLVIAIAVAVPGFLAWLSTKRLEAKTDVIKSSVDGAATKQAAKLDAALEQLKFMTERLAKEETKALVLAAGVSQMPAQVAVVPVVPVAPVTDIAPVVETLKSIDANTAAIDANTKGTVK